MQTILITGATAGIGRITALHLARQGHHVIATGRKTAELEALAREAGELRVDTLPLDVTSASSIASAVTAVGALTAGRGVDVLVNNAGFGVLGPTSEISDAELRRQYDTNVFGLMAVTRAFLPAMRERRAGRIINLSSVGGLVTLPFFGVYNSTKYAVESLSDALRYELRAFGIDVVLVEPGVIRTNFEATAVASLHTFAASPYGAAIARYEQLSRRLDRFASDPLLIARTIGEAVAARRPRARYVAPFSSTALILLKAVAPTRVFDWTMRKVGFLTPAALGLTPRAATASESTPVARPVAAG